MNSPVLSSADISAYLSEVADLLGDDTQPKTVILVGGAALAFWSVREGTHDVDSVEGIDSELAEAVKVVAARHNLPPKWLNDKAAGWRPSTLDPKKCVVVLERRRLRVLSAPASDVFLMKLNASRSRDLQDLAALWPTTGFRSPEEAAEAYSAAYPSDPQDEHLADFIRSVVRRPSDDETHPY